MLELRKLRFWTLAAAIGLSFSPALAEQNEGCGEIAAAVNPKGDDKVAPVPEQALSDVKTAVSCLAGEIEKFGADVRSDRFDHRTAEKLLSATEALRTIMTRGVSSSDAQEISPELKLFIDVFRSVADNRLRIISALSFGMRDDNPQLRLNSALILGNVIDDNTVCVPLIHLNDVGLARTAVGVRGRANLLSVISVVAPWATKQNFETMDATRTKIYDNIDNKDDPNFTSTLALLENIKLRLASQAPESNKQYSMQETQLDLCKKYMSDVQPALKLDRGNLKY